MNTIMHVTEVTSGGILPVVVGLCNGLADEYRVVLAYGIRPDTPANFESLFDKRVILVPVKAFIRELNLVKDIKASSQLRKLIREYKPDLIHMHSSKAGFVGRMGLLTYRCVKFYTPHGYSFLNSNSSSIKRRLYHFAELTMGKLPCCTVACGQGEYEIAIGISRKAALIHNGIDTGFIDEIVKKTEKENNDGYTVYTAGRIGPQKNPELFNQIAKKLPDVRFVWIGGGEDAKLLTEPNIEVTGVVNREQVIEKAKNFDCYLSCAVFEGLPIALMEAMYMGKLCVVTDVGGNNELISQESGFLYRDLDECVAIIQKIKNNPEIYKKFAERVKEDIRNNYSMEKMCMEYKKLVQANS